MPDLFFIIIGIAVIVILERTFKVLRNEPPIPKHPAPYTEGLDDMYIDTTDGMLEK